MATNNNAINRPKWAFCLRMATAVPDITGDGTAYYILYDTVDFSNFGLAAPTNIVTVPYTGQYYFSMQTVFTGLSAANTATTLAISPTGVPAEYSVVYMGIVPHVNGAASVGGSTIMNLVAGTTVGTYMTTFGGAKIVGIDGSTDIAVRFNGYLIE